MKKGVSGLLVVMFFTACGQKALSPEQKQIIKEVTQSASQTMNSGKNSRKMALNDSSGDILSQRFSDGSCKFDMENPNHFKISGEKCPISVEVSSSNFSDAGGDVLMRFTVLDAELKKQIDVTSMEIKGKVAIGGDSIKADLDGKLHSEKRGDIGFEEHDQIEKDTVNVTASLKFADFTATFHVEGTKNSLKYFINGEEVTAQQFSDYLNGMGQTGSASSSSTSTESYQYRYNINGCDTGEQKFDTLQALCAGLQNYSLNKGCAPEQRATRFKSAGCPGTFQDK